MSPTSAPWIGSTQELAERSRVPLAEAIHTPRRTPMRATLTSLLVVVGFAVCPSTALATPFSDGAIIVVKDAKGTALLGTQDDQNGTVAVAYTLGGVLVHHLYTPTTANEPNPGETVEQPEFTATGSIRPPHGEVAPRTATLYLVEPTKPCGCTENETPPPAVSDVVTLNVSKPGGSAEFFDFKFDFFSDPDPTVPTTLPTGAVTLTEDGTYQHLESFFFTAANGYAPGDEPFIVLYKSCS